MASPLNTGAVPKRHSGLGLDETKIIFTVQIRLRYKSFNDLEFRLGSRLLDRIGYGSG